jgi:hypothetical protein
VCERPRRFKPVRAAYLPLRTRASFRCSTINAMLAPITMRATVALKLPGAIQLMQVPIIVGASCMVRPSLNSLRRLKWRLIFRSQLRSWRSSARRFWRDTQCNSLEILPRSYVMPIPAESMHCSGPADRRAWATQGGNPNARIATRGVATAIARTIAAAHHRFTDEHGGTARRTADTPR